MHAKLRFGGKVPTDRRGLSRIMRSVKECLLKLEALMGLTPRGSHLRM